MSELTPDDLNKEISNLLEYDLIEIEDADKLAGFRVAWQSNLDRDKKRIAELKALLDTENALDYLAPNRKVKQLEARIAELEAALDEAKRGWSHTTSREHHTVIRMETGGNTNDNPN